MSNKCFSVCEGVHPLSVAVVKLIALFIRHLLIIIVGNACELLLSGGQSFSYDYDDVRYVEAIVPMSSA